MALSWRNLPSALKAAIGIGKRTLAILAGAHGMPWRWTRGKTDFGPQQAAGPPLAALDKAGPSAFCWRLVNMNLPAGCPVAGFSFWPL